MVKTLKATWLVAKAVAKGVALGCKVARKTAIAVLLVASIPLGLILTALTLNGEVLGRSIDITIEHAKALVN